MKQTTSKTCHPTPRTIAPQLRSKTATDTKVTSAADETEHVSQRRSLNGENESKDKERYGLRSNIFLPVDAFGGSMVQDYL